MSKSNWNYLNVYTLCLDCRNATKPWVCPWAENATPVKGWRAKKTVVGNSYTYDSYLVTDCPLFHRDGHRGGQEQDLFGAKERISLDDQDTVNLAEAICERAVEDWFGLERGKLEYANVTGTRVWRNELIEFFFSEWFTVLLGSFTERPAQQIREMIGVTEDMNPKTGVTHRRVKRRNTQQAEC